MKNFSAAGQTLFFENTRCLNCGKAVGFDTGSRQMYPTHPDMQDAPRGPGVLCRNASDFGVCNWFVSDQDSDFCLSCTLNHTIPNLLEPDRRRWWKSLEQAKPADLLPAISALPVVSKGDARDGLAFKFIEDQRTNPLVREEFVYRAQRRLINQYSGS